MTFSWRTIIAAFAAASISHDASALSGAPCTFSSEAPRRDSVWEARFAPQNELRRSLPPVRSSGNVHSTSGTSSVCGDRRHHRGVGERDLDDQQQVDVRALQRRERGERGVGLVVDPRLADERGVEALQRLPRLFEHRLRELDVERRASHGEHADPGLASASSCSPMAARAVPAASGACGIGVRRRVRRPARSGSVRGRPIVSVSGSFGNDTRLASRMPTAAPDGRWSCISLPANGFSCGTRGSPGRSYRLDQGPTDAPECRFCIRISASVLLVSDCSGVA